MTSAALPFPLPDVLDLSIPVPPASLEQARADRDGLASLLDREHQAAADFLVAFADFDRRRCWERLGHGSLFAFLTRELALSKGAAYLRLTAARLLPRFPAVEAGLREGRLCLSSVGELAKVLTAENEATVLPRFVGCSAREAREVVAAIRPCAAPPVREVVSRLPRVEARSIAEAQAPSLFMAAPSLAPAWPTGLDATVDPAIPTPPAPAPAAPFLAAPDACPAGVVLTSEPPQPPPARVPRAAAEPLTADLRRLHLTVSKGFLEKVEQARHGLSHARPDATLEQVLEAALDLLLGRQARRKALVGRPRASAAPRSSPTPRRPHVPAAVERAVRQRDGNRCAFPLDAGGVCGSTWRVELDHLVPLALGGETAVANLRCLCARHNRAAAEAALGGLARIRR